MWINAKKLKSIPFSYNLRSLLMRKGGSALTIGSIALTVMVFTVMAGLSNGLKKTYSSTGRDDVLIVLSKGADGAEVSHLDQATLFILKYHRALKRRADGSPLFSPEGYSTKPLYGPSVSGKAPEKRWLPIRGIERENLDLYPKISITEGRSLLHPGDVLVGQLVSTRLGKLHLGDIIEMGRQKHRVVGFFSSQGTAYESELWVLNEDLLLDYELPGQSIAVFSVADGFNPQDVISDIKRDPRLQLEVKTERDYFSDMARNTTFIQIVGNVISFILSIGALFAGMNTMYASVSARVREIGTLRAMGFSRSAIQLSFIMESMILGAVSGLLGVIAALLFNGASLSFMHSAFHISVDFTIALEGFGLALLVSFLGGYFPARTAAKMKIVDVMNG